MSCWRTRCFVRSGGWVQSERPKFSVYICRIGQLRLCGSNIIKNPLSRMGAIFTACPKRLAWAAGAAMLLAGQQPTYVACRVADLAVWAACSPMFFSHVSPRKFNRLTANPPHTRRQRASVCAASVSILLP